MRVTWDGGAGDGLWNSPENWSTDRVPDPLDLVLIADAVVTIDGPITLRRALTIQPGATLNVSGALLIEQDGVVVSGADAAIVIHAPGSVELRNGQFLNGGTITNSGAFTCQAGGIVSNTGSFANEDGGRVDNRGQTTNVGTLSNAPGGDLTNAGVLVNHHSLANAGVLLNTRRGVITNTAAAIFTNRDNGRIENAGGLTNLGSLENAAECAIVEGGRIENEGRLINRGRVIHDGAAFRNVRQGLIENHATIVSHAQISLGGLVRDSPARLENRADGDITLDGRGSLVSFGTTVINHAQASIHVIGNASLVNTGRLVNHGHVDIAHLLSSDRAIEDDDAEIVNHPGATIHVSGVVRNRAMLRNHGSVIVDDEGTVENGRDGTLRNGAGSQVEIRSGGILHNEGSVDNAGTLAPRGGDLRNDGRVWNLRGGVLKVSEAGTVLNGKEGFVRNQGVIELIQRPADQGNWELENKLGEIENQEGGKLTAVSGRLRNDGGIVRNSAGGTIELRDDALILNRVGVVPEEGNNGFGLPQPGRLVNLPDAQLRLTGDALIRNQPGAHLDNQGLISNDGRIRNEAGTVTNGAGAELMNGTNGRLSNHLEDEWVFVGGAARLEQRIGTLTNDGTLVNQGEIENEGRIDNRQDARFDNDGGELRNPGVFSNNDGADLRVVNAGRFDNTGGTFSSFGVVETADRDTRFINGIDGEARNHGAMVNGEGARLENRALWIQHGTLRNRGRLDNVGARVIENHGAITNESAGEVVTAGTLRNLTGGLCTNAGRLENSGDVTNAGGRFENVGQMANYGAITNDNHAHLTNARGGVLDNAVGGMVINRHATVTNGGGTFSNGGTLSHGPHGIFINKRGGEIRNSGEIALGDACFLVNRGDVDNHDAGIIRSNQGASIVNRGGLNNREDAVIELNAGSQIQNESEIRNAAKIDLNGLLRLGDDSVVDNLGVIRVFCDGRIVNDERIAGNPIVDACD